MSKTIKISNKVDFVKNFLSPISKISDSCVIEIRDNKLNCLTCPTDNSLILSIQFDIEGEFDNNETLNCPDVKKLIKAIDNINDTSIEFTLENNNLSYKDKSIRFKYHLHEDGIIKRPKLSLQKLEETQFYSSFLLKDDKIKELVKGSVFSSDSNKVYLFSDNGGVYAELTDRTRHNIDTITLKVADEYHGDDIESLPLNFEIFRMIDISSTKSIAVKINNKLGLVIFDLMNNYNKTVYIISSLTK